MGIWTSLTSISNTVLVYGSLHTNAISGSHTEVNYTGWINLLPFQLTLLALNFSLLSYSSLLVHGVV